MKRFLWMIILISFITFCTEGLAGNDTAINEQDGNNTSEFKIKPNPKITFQTEKVTQAGKKVGDSINLAGNMAAKYMGAWVNAEFLFGITWLKSIACLFLLLLLLVIERLFQWWLQMRLKNITTTDEIIPWGKLALRALSKPLSLFIWVYGVYFSMSPIFIHFQTNEGENLVQLVVQKSADIGGIIAIIWFLIRIVDLIDIRLKKWAASTENTLDDVLSPLVGKALRIFIASLGGLILLQNLTGLKIGPLIASLGIGGLAFALAAKESIANFFGTLTILFDKPFQVGERIIINGYDGVVEEVGFRSTRIRTLTGHLVTIPNENVISASIENIGRRPYIRWLTNITITYDTPPDKAEKAVQIIRDILENHEGLNTDFPPRVFFNGFNDWSLNILTIAWYHPPNYWDFCAWQQTTCLKIMTAFEKENIDFAFPSRTVYLANDDKRQLKLDMLKGSTS